MKRITNRDLRACHPLVIECETDTYYSNFANKLAAELAKVCKENNFDDMCERQDAFRNMVLRLTLYFEDIVSELGLWAACAKYAFSDTAISDSYRQSLLYEPTPEAIYFIVALSDTSDKEKGEKMPAMDPRFAGIVQRAFTFMQERFDDAPFNDELTDLLIADAPKADHLTIKNVCSWLLLNSYLSAEADVSTKEKLSYKIEEAGLTSREADYAAASSSALTCPALLFKATPPIAYARLLENTNSALLTKEQTSLMVERLNGIKAVPFKMLRVESLAASQITFADEDGSRMAVDREEFGEALPRMEEIHEAAFVSLMCYDGKWHLNGVSYFQRDFPEGKQKEYNEYLLNPDNFENPFEEDDDFEDEYEDGEEEEDEDFIKELMDGWEKMRKDLEREKALYPSLPYSYNDTAEYPKHISIDKPLEKYFLRKKNIAQPPADLVEHFRSLPPEELRRQLQDVLLHSIYCFRNLKRSKIKVENLHAAVLWLGEVGDSHSLEVLLQTLRQSDDYLAFFFGDFTENAYTPALCRLARGNERVLADFTMLSEGVESYSRSYAFGALTQSYLHDFISREEYLSHARRILTFFLDHWEEHRYTDATLVSFIICNLLHCQCQELLPLLRELGEKDAFNTFVCGNMEEVEQDITSKRDPLSYYKKSLDLQECIGEWGQ